MKTVAIATLGCKTNQFESAAITEQFGRAGYTVVPFTEPADIYVINSCTVTARTDSETRRMIRRARRLNPQARIVATGCYAQVSPEELSRMPEVDVVLGNLEKLDTTLLAEAPQDRVADTGAETTFSPSSSPVSRSTPGPSCRSRTAAIPSAPTASCPLPAAEAAAFRAQRCWTASGDWWIRAFAKWC